MYVCIYMFVRRRRYSILWPQCWQVYRVGTVPNRCMEHWSRNCTMNASRYTTPGPFRHGRAMVR